jgi:hypothetical protein
MTATGGVEYPLWRELLLFPYRAFVSWWLDALLHRPSDAVFKRFFEKEFGAFMAKHELRPIENPAAYNLLGVWFNGKWLTLRSPAVEMRLTQLAGFSIAVRPAGTEKPWRHLGTIFDEFNQPQERSWSAVIEFLDLHWDRLVEGLR